MQTELYFNTTSYTGVQLTERVQKSASQQEQVYDVFKSVKKPMAWWEVAKYLPKMNEVSLKRSITNLKTCGCIILTNEYNTSPYGHRSKKYTLNENNTI